MYWNDYKLYEFENPNNFYRYVFEFTELMIGVIVVGGILKFVFIKDEKEIS